MGYILHTSYLLTPMIILGGRGRGERAKIHEQASLKDIFQYHVRLVSSDQAVGVWFAMLVQAGTLTLVGTSKKGYHNILFYTDSNVT